MGDPGKYSRRRREQIHEEAERLAEERTRSLDASLITEDSWRFFLGRPVAGAVRWFRRLLHR